MEGARAIGARDVKAMRTELDAMTRASEAGDRGAFLAHDRRFHALLYAASDAPQLVARIDELLESGRRIVDPYVYRPWYPLKVATEAHRPILEAVERHDAALVEQLIRDNIARAGERALVAFEEDARPGPTRTRPGELAGRVDHWRRVTGAPPSQEQPSVSARSTAATPWRPASASTSAARSRTSS